MKMKIKEKISLQLPGLMSIRNKLFVLLLGAGLTGTAITAYFSYQTAKDALEKQVFSHLISVRDVKRKQIERYFKEQLSHIEIHGIDPFFAQYLMDRKYLVSKNASSKILTVDENFRKKFQIEMGSSIKKHGFYDIFLIDLKGNVLHSIKEEDDLGTNLITGNYKTTSLASAFNAGLKRPTFSDLEFYKPSKGIISAFFAAPVKYEESSEVLGVIAAQIDTREINAIMQERSGLGETGETFLLGMDMLLRSDSRFFKKHAALRFKVNRESYKRLLAGKTENHKTLDYRNVPVLHAHAPVYIPGLNWMIVAKMDTEEAFAEIFNLKWKIFYGSLILLLFILFVSYYVSNKFTAPINALKEKMSDMSSFMQGSQAIAVTSRDEIGLLVESFNKMSFKINFQTNEIEKTNKNLKEELIERKKLEEYLRKSKERFYSHVENLSLIAVGLNKKGTVQYANKALCQLLGFNKNEIIGKTWMKEFIPDKYKSEIKNMHKDAINKNNFTKTFENPILLSNGDERLIKWNNTVLRDLDGTPIETMSLGEDITERKQAEEELKNAFSMLQATLESTADGILAVNPNGKIANYNKQFQKMWRIPDSIMKLKDDDKVLGFVENQLKDPKKFLVKVSNIYQEPEAIIFDTIEFKDGRIFERYSQPQKTGDQTIGRVFSFRDVTDRKRTETALRESEEKFRELVESIHEVFWMENLGETELLYVSPAYEQIWGRTCQSFYDNPKSWIDAIHHEDRQRVIDAFSQGRLNGAYSEEFRILRPDGSIRWIWDRSVLVKDHLGKVLRIAGIAEDITTRKQMEETIKASLQEKEVLLREIHHRVKNNMQVVSSLLMLQSEYLNDEKDIELFKESQNRIKSMAIIHENLYQSEDLAKIDFRDYVKNLSDGLLRSYNINGNKIIALKVDIKDVSLGIETAIPCSLIINELISNSIKYAFPFDKLRAGSLDFAQDRPDTKKCEIKISMSKKKDGEIELIVADNGVSMPKDLDFRDTRTLGLQLVTGLAENQLDGKIELKISKGTEFRIRFKELQDKKRI